jgi:hypothetical protein
MKHTSHGTKRMAFWLLLASLFAMGLVLLFYLPSHKASGSLALGVLALIVLKHIGLFLVVGSPLAGMVNVARARFARLWRRGGDKSSA